MKLTSAEELKQLIAIASLKWTLNDSPENTANLLGEIRQIQANAIRWAAWQVLSSEEDCGGTSDALNDQANQLDPIPESFPDKNLQSIRQSDD